MRFRGHAVGLVLLGLLVASCSAANPQQPDANACAFGLEGTVTVKVVDASGQPVSGVRVGAARGLPTASPAPATSAKLSCAPPPSPPDVRTDAMGTATFDVYRTGFWTMTLLDAIPVTSVQVEVHEGDHPTVMLTAPAASPTPAPPQ